MGISGIATTRLGDFVAGLFKALSTCKDRHAVSEAITGVAPDLLQSLPQLFPDLFDGSSKECAEGPAEHHGIRCSACNREPIKGPRFHCAEACIDLCGECFIAQGCEAADQQFQCFFVAPGTQGASMASREGSAANAAGSWREHMKAWQDKHKEQCHAWKKAWKEHKEVWKEQKAHWKKGEMLKGKGKGKGKGKHMYWWLTEGPGAEAAEEDANSTVSNSMASGPVPDASDAGDSAPPGLEVPSAAWGDTFWYEKLLKGKGHGKHHGKPRPRHHGKDWEPMWPWGAHPWEGPMMHPPFPPHCWHWGCDTGVGSAPWAPSDGHWSQFDIAAFESIAANTGSEGGRQEGNDSGKVVEEQTEGDHPN